MKKIILSILIFCGNIYAKPKYQVGDCLTIKKTILSIKIMEIRKNSYMCYYYIPWEYRYVPNYELSFEDAVKPEVHKTECY